MRSLATEKREKKDHCLQMFQSWKFTNTILRTLSSHYLSVVFQVMWVKQCIWTARSYWFWVKEREASYRHSKRGGRIEKNIHLIESIGRFSEREDTLVFLLFFAYEHNSTCRWVRSWEKWASFENTDEHGRWFTLSPSAPLIHETNFFCNHIWKGVVQMDPVERSTSWITGKQPF